MRRLLPFFVVVLGLVACATPSQPFEGHPVLAAIRFEGNHSISGGDLQSKIITAPTSGFPGKTARYYDADLFAIDLKRIVRWYNQKGFYEAKVLDVREERDGEGRVSLVVKIDEGRRAIVKTMDATSSGEITADELHRGDDALPIHPGDAFDEDTWEKAKTVLEEQIKERGFAEARVTGRVEVEPDQGWAHLRFEVDAGRKYRFGRILVTGNHQVPSDLIAQATGIERGDPYSPTALELAQQRVYNLGAFSGARVSLEPLGNGNTASVRINVREAPFQTVRLGLGLQIEESRWELPRLRAEYTNRNFFGSLRRLELQSTVGYAFVDSPFNYHSEQSGITGLTSAQLTVPNVVLPGLDYIARGEFDREIQAGYRYDEVAARTGFIYRRARHTLAPTLNFVRYFDVALGGTSLDKLLAKTGTAAGLINECGHSCTLTYPELRYTYDARDNALETTTGFLATASIQQALKPGAFDYFRVDPEVRFYRPLGRFLVVATRFAYGAIVAEGGSRTPFTQRFFGGGQNGQRGYAPLRQGPKIGAGYIDCTQPGAPIDPATGTCLPYARQSIPIGGTSSVLVSGELRIRADALLNHLGIVPFVDASRVQDSPSAPFEGGLEVAPGLGLRYLTPFGPVRLDVAWVVNPIAVTTPPYQPQGSPVPLQTRIGHICDPADPRCIHEQRWAFHLALGEAF